MILKGFVEVTDPAVIIAKLIIDISNAIVFTTIAAIKMGIQIAKQNIETGIMTAKSMMLQLEMQIGMAAASLEAISKSLQPSQVKDAVNIDTSADEVDQYVFDVDRPKAEEGFYEDMMIWRVALV